MTSRALLLAVALLALSSATARAAGPSAGEPSLNDRLDPGLGNGGYDVLHYDLDLRYATSAPTQSIDGTVTIFARATQALSRFDLDFAGPSVGSVSVDGAPARSQRVDEELVITPRRFLRDGETFVVRVSRFTAVPTEPTEEFDSTALFPTEDGSATAGQPFSEHLVYPSNDHPRDKATFTFRLDVPAGTTAVANGVPLGHFTKNGRTTWLYAQRQPMATELTQLAMGDLRITSPGGHPGVLLRDATPTAITDQLRPFLALEPSQIDWMEDRVGRYPFDAYGSLVVRSDLGFSLETQTLTIHPADLFDTDFWDPTMLHELSHSWFGDSVSPYEWSDLWLNEGHASWYEFLYAEEKGELVDDTIDYPDENGYATMDELMRAVYAHGDQWRHDWGPVALPSSPDTMFSFQVYHGGALVLYALRQVVGAATFQRIERAWVERYRDQSRSTAAFIALASQVAHRDLSGFLRAWLYGDRTPRMPGHPEWKVDPVQEQSPSAQRIGGRLRRR
jgi:aminopeptidase N